MSGLKSIERKIIGNAATAWGCEESTARRLLLDRELAEKIRKWEPSGVTQSDVNHALCDCIPVVVATAAVTATLASLVSPQSVLAANLVRPGFEDVLHKRPVNCSDVPGIVVNGITIEKVVRRENPIIPQILANSGSFDIRFTNGRLIPDIRIKPHFSMSEQSRLVAGITKGATRLFVDVGSNNEPAVWAVSQAMGIPRTVIVAVDPNPADARCDDTHPIMRPEHLDRVLGGGSNAVQIRARVAFQDLVVGKAFSKPADVIRFVAFTPGVLQQLGPAGVSNLEAAAMNLAPKGYIFAVANTDYSSDLDNVHIPRAGDINEIIRVSQAYGKRLTSIEISPAELGVFMDPNGDLVQKVLLNIKYAPYLHLLDKMGPWSSSFAFLYPESTPNGHVSKADTRPLTIYAIGPKEEDETSEEQSRNLVIDSLIVISVAIGAKAFTSALLSRRSSENASVGEPRRHRGLSLRRRRKEEVI